MKMESTRVFNFAVGSVMLSDITRENKTIVIGRLREIQEEHNEAMGTIKAIREIVENVTHRCKDDMLSMDAEEAIEALSRFLTSSAEPKNEEEEKWETPED